MAGQHKTATVTAGPLSPSFTERRDELRHAQAEIDKLVEEGTPEAREKLKQSIVSRQRLLGDDADADADLDIPNYSGRASISAMPGMDFPAGGRSREKLRNWLAIGACLSGLLFVILIGLLRFELSKQAVESSFNSEVKGIEKGWRMGQGIRKQAQESPSWSVQGPNDAHSPAGIPQPHPPRHESDCQLRTQLVQADRVLQEMNVSCSEYLVRPMPQCKPECRNALKRLQNSTCVSVRVQGLDPKVRLQVLALQNLAFRRCFSPACHSKTEASAAWSAITSLQNSCSALSDTVKRREAADRKSIGLARSNRTCTSKCARVMQIFVDNDCAFWILEQVVQQMPADYTYEWWRAYNGTRQNCQAAMAAKCINVKTEGRHSTGAALDAVKTSCSKHQVLPMPICSAPCRSALVSLSKKQCASVMIDHMSRAAREDFEWVHHEALKRCFHAGCSKKRELAEATQTLIALRKFCLKTAGAEKCDEACATTLVVYEQAGCVRYLWNQTVAAMGKAERRSFWDRFNRVRTRCSGEGRRHMNGTLPVWTKSLGVAAPSHWTKSLDPHHHPGKSKIPPLLTNPTAPKVVSDKKTFVNTKKGEEEIETRKLSDGEVQKRTRFEGK